MSNKNEKGLSIVEFMIIVSIIAILSALIISSIPPKKPSSNSKENPAKKVDPAKKVGGEIKHVDGHKILIIREAWKMTAIDLCHKPTRGKK